MQVTDVEAQHVSSREQGGVLGVEWSSPTKVMITSNRKAVAEYERTAA